MINFFCGKLWKKGTKENEKPLFFAALVFLSHVVFFRLDLITFVSFELERKSLPFCFSSRKNRSIKSIFSRKMKCVSAKTM